MGYIEISIKDFLPAGGTVPFVILAIDIIVGQPCLSSSTSSCKRASGNFDWYLIFQSEMNGDHFYGDPQYSWDSYIQA